MVSNRGLAVIIIVAVVFSLSAQFISIFWLSQVSTAPVHGPTAYATGSGEVKLNITTSTDISVSNSTVNFGNGLVNSTICSFANLSNNGTGSNQPNSASNGVGCWVNDTSGPGKGDQQAVEVANTKIVVQNDGSRNVTLTMTSAQGNAANFVGNCSTEANGLYLFAAVSNESGDAVALSTCTTTHLTTGWTTIDGTAQDVCDNMNFEDSADAIAIIFNLSICRSTDQSGSINDSLTFTSAAA